MDEQRPLHNVEAIDTKDDNVALDNKTCYNCGKTFRRPAEYLRHKNRKTPCLIREVKPEDRNNPNRCIYCNKIFKQHCHLLRHFKVCKIKNGGMDVLADKVQHDEEIRLLREEREQDRQRIQAMEARIEEMSKMIIGNTTTNNINNTTNNINNTTNNNTINNNTINNNITIQFCDYDKPDLTNVRITLDDLLSDENILKMLFSRVWFNADVPQNHTIHLPNVKDKRLIVYQNAEWQNLTAEAYKRAVDDIERLVWLIADSKIKFAGLWQGDAEFRNLPQEIRQRIGALNDYNIEFAENEIRDVAVTRRAVVDAALKAAMTNAKAIAAAVK